MALTPRYVVFLDLPVVCDLARARGGGMPYRFDPRHPARIGLLRLDDPEGPVRWFRVAPCYVFHVLNAHEDAADRVVVDVVRYPHLWWEGHGKADAVPWRWTLDPLTGTAGEEQLDDRPCEFPRIDDRFAGRAVRFGHVTDAAEPGSGRSGAIIRYHLATGKSTAHEFGPGRTPGEATFVPRSDTPGGDGWLLTYVYDATTDRSYLVVLDTADLASPPTAVVHLPWRVPYGFHGNWIPDEGRA